MSDAIAIPKGDSPASGTDADVTLPEAIMLLLFDPRNGTISGEGHTLMYTLGGAMITELALHGHIELDDGQRRTRRVGGAPENSLLRVARERVPETSTGLRSLVVDIGTRSREPTLDRLIARGDIRKEPDAQTATLIALLSASKNLPAMHADIPWSGDVYTRGKKFERGEWGARAPSDVILSTLVVQIAAAAFTTTLAAITKPD